MKEWALVTGGSRNIGAGIAKRLREDGFLVMIASRSPPEHDDYDQFVSVDFLDPAGAASALQDTIADKAVTRFVHNAAITNTDQVEDVPLKIVSDIYTVNVVAFVALSQIVIPKMREAGVGRIVVIGSRAGLGKSRRSAYSASKSALSGLVRTMALELGGDGITVNCVAPGPIETSMFRTSTVPGSIDYINLNKGVPVGFIGEPADIGHAVSYFLSDGARFCTGQLIHLCGGTSIGFVSPEGRDVHHRFSNDFPE